MSIIERGVVVATVLAAVLAGGATGLGLHAWRPDPLALAAGRDSAGSPDGSATSSPTPAKSAKSSKSSKSTATSGSTESDEASASPTDDESESSAPKTTSTTAPAFTVQALLQPANFTDHGWVTARTTKSYDGLPDPPITPCAPIRDEDFGGVDEGYGAQYRSTHTESTEIVARFPSTSKAESAYADLLDNVTNCADTAVKNKVVIEGFAHTTQASRVDSIRWWNTVGEDDSSIRGVIAVVRSANRIAVVTLSSADSDPADTTDIDELLIDAGQRLV